MGSNPGGSLRWTEAGQGRDRNESDGRRDFQRSCARPVVWPGQDHRPAYVRRLGYLSGGGHLRHSVWGSAPLQGGRPVEGRLRGHGHGAVPPQRASDLEVVLRSAARGVRRPRDPLILGRGGDPGGAVFSKSRMSSDSSPITPREGLSRPVLRPRYGFAASEIPIREGAGTMADIHDRALLAGLVDAYDRIAEDSLGMGDPEFHEVEAQLFEAIDDAGLRAVIKNGSIYLLDHNGLPGENILVDPVEAEGLADPDVLNLDEG